MSLESTEPSGARPLRSAEWFHSAKDHCSRGRADLQPRLREAGQHELTLPDGEPLWVLCNHFKSKGYGNPAANDDKRRHQARRVRDLVSRFDLARDRVVVAGDLNDTPEGGPLRELLETPRLYDALDKLPEGEPRWTYRDGRDQIDYLLVSEPLWRRIGAVGIERRGMWSRSGFGGRFPCFAEVTDLRTQAPDHAAVWVDVGVG